MIKKGIKYILIFSAYIPPHVGGVERYTFNLAKYLLKYGYSVIIVTSNYGNDDSFENKDGVIVIRLPIYNMFKNRYPIIRFNKKFKKLLNKLNDFNIVSVIVNTRFYFTSHIGVWYANKKNIPVYLIEHGSNYVTVNNKFIDFFANRYEDIVTFCLKNKVNGFYGVSDACGMWLNNFRIQSSGTWYNSIEFNENVVKKKEHDEVNFLYAGRIIKQKGVYNILSAFNNLAKKYDYIHLYIAGDGIELENYKKNFFHNRIHFLGKLDYNELFSYYSICDIFLYPPLWKEGLPTSILEAGMMKCAVIATDQGGINEIIKNDVNGIMIDNITDLENKMEKLILNDEDRRKLADNLFITIKKKFSWDVTTKKILKDINLR